MKRNKGFTLIELLVVIAIIGILSSVVLASLNTAREKARDARRISDIKAIQLALELSADNNDGNYPDALADLETEGLMQEIPVDPSTGAAYDYASNGETEYHLGALLENDAAGALPDNDADCISEAVGFTCFAAGLTGGFDGTADQVYDQAVY